MGRSLLVVSRDHLLAKRLQNAPRAVNVCVVPEQTSVTSETLIYLVYWSPTGPGRESEAKPALSEVKQ